MVLRDNHIRYSLSIFLLARLWERGTREAKRSKLTLFGVGLDYRQRRFAKVRGWKKPGGMFKIRSTEETTEDKVRSSIKKTQESMLEENSWDNKT